MKVLLILTSLILMNTISAQSTETDPVKIISQVKKMFAPDKRTALFEIETEITDNRIILKGETNLPEAKSRLSDELTKAGIIFMDKINLLPDASLGDKTYGIVSLSVANIRSKPAHSAELATQALMGTPVKVLKKESGFYLVQTPDNYIAWIDDDGFYSVNKNELGDWLNSDRVIFIAETGSLFKNSDCRGEKISDLVAGNILKLIGEGSEYFEVMIPDGRSGYVNKNECQRFNQWLKMLSPDGNSIVETAKTMMGLPYLWGGTSTKGVDCSGFTKTVYFLNGLILPRDASQQVNSGGQIDTGKDFQNLLAGDLLFFGTKGDEIKKERITHVAIYLGDQDFIHSSGRVRIDSFDRKKSNYNKYRHDTFIRARRILTSVDNNDVYSISNHNFYTGK
ncbi:MAG: C40 family peptidase [Ignavibacteriales bacterium]|nr:C40 family peptidase [Ignavibacteriales bacterium]